MLPPDGKILDARDLLCPLPVLKARKILLSLPAGSVLEILSRDPRAPDEFRSFCAEQGHDFLGHAEQDGVLRLRVARGA